ncbi:hypothetical protein PHMEG_00024457 [Phytophthora megakarya]|uniref:Uncharacterized protein n=1 Tax=Phytophthora megakarya TaxID=4795 RepID=A0A225VG62_9STRA|nr:hypothetical protein PHMEG_00024457 [Phytophthora megakarya]
MKLFITMAFRILRLNMPHLECLEVLEIKAMLDAVDDTWRDYNLDRVKRNDRLCTKYPYICWKWSLESPPPVDGTIPEFLFEPSMPLYGMEYLTWIPKTPIWLKEVAKIDAREPDRPRYVPVGHSLVFVEPLIVRDPALTSTEIVGGWEKTFEGSPLVVESLVTYDPTLEGLVEPADSPELLLLDRLMSLDKVT